MDNKYPEFLLIHSDVETNLQSFLVGSSFEGVQLTWLDCMEKRMTYVFQVSEGAVLDDLRSVLHGKEFVICGRTYRVYVEREVCGVSSCHDGTFIEKKEFLVTIR